MPVGVERMFNHLMSSRPVCHLHAETVYKSLLHNSFTSSLQSYGAAQNSKSDPFPTLYLTKFCILSLVPLVVNLHAKLEVSSSNRSRDMAGVPKFEK